ncbi:MAG: PrsW family glutamic-type intramembrane protease [Acidimicrobiales bacterium]
MSDESMSGHDSMSGHESPSNYGSMNPVDQTQSTTGHAPGWYADPWRMGPWRWWDGEAWTAHVSQAEESKPRLPAWLSVPVIIGLLATIISMLLLLALSPGPTSYGIALGFVPLIIVMPVLSWLDRVEPEPRSSRIHALLWGGAVAGFVSGVVNSVVAVVSSEAWAAVVSAPLIEELMKGLGIIWALKRREVDGVMDGIVYAGWVALGFAIIEDVLYFSNAAEQGILTQVFLLRAIFTPFAHPLFTAWTGLAIGLAVARQQSVLANAFWGYGLAVASHAAWNGSLTYADETGNAAAIVIAAACFVLLFFAAVVTVVLIRRDQQRKFTELIPMLAQRHSLTPEEVGVFGNWKRMLATRRATPRSKRAAFDRVHASLARLALFYRRVGTGDPATEQLLANQLQQARAAQFAATAGQ